MIGNDTGGKLARVEQPIGRYHGEVSMSKVTLLAGVAVCGLLATQPAWAQDGQATQPASPPARPAASLPQGPAPPSPSPLPSAAIPPCCSTAIRSILSPGCVTVSPVSLVSAAKSCMSTFHAVV